MTETPGTKCPRGNFLGWMLFAAVFKGLCGYVTIL